MPQPLRAIIIEDRDEDVELMLHELAADGLELDAKRVDNEAQFLEALKNPPDVVLADYNLPQFGALPALRLLRARGLDTPFIVVTGSLDEEAAVEVIKQGADDYLLKDRLARLGKAVERALAERKLAREKREAERRVAESEERYRRLVEWSPEAIVVQQDGRFVYANAAAAGLLGALRTDDLLGRPIMDFVHPDFRVVVAERVDRVVRTGLNSPLLEQRLVRMDGREIAAEVASTPTIHAGRPAVQTIIRDITERQRAERALRHSEELNRRIIEAGPGGIVLVNADGSLVHANEVAQKFLGLSWDELTRRFVRDWTDATIREDGTPFPPDEYPVTRCLKTGEAEPPVIIGVWRPDRALVWGFFAAVPLKDAHGRTTGAIVTFVDITDRKRAEEALRTSEERYRLLFEANPQPMWVIDNQTMRFLAVNQAAVRKYGWTREEFLSMDLRDIRPEEDIPKLNAVLAQTDGALTGLLLRHKLKDGRLIDVEINSTPIEFEGRSARIALANDITERLKAERALRESQQMLALHVEQTPLGSITWDTDFRVVQWNPSAERIFGYTRAEAIGKRGADLIVPMPARPQVERVWGELVERRGGTRSANENITKDHRTILCEWYNTPLVDASGKTVGVASLVQDVTNRAQAEAALRRSEEHYRQAAESNARLLQEVNHRVRNNLASLMGLISLTRKKARDVNDLASALEARVMALSQIHNMLADTGWRDLNLRLLVTDLLASMQRTAPHIVPVQIEGPDLSISPRQSLPLAMSLLEMVINSTKHGAHTAPGGSIRVAWEIIDRDGAPTVRLRWTERGGPPIDRPVVPSLGTELIEGFVSFELGGRAKLSFPREGVEHVLEFPADSPRDEVMLEK